MQELATWLQHPDPQAFPYDAVVAEFHRVGKHFVADDVLLALDRARALLDPEPDPLLAGFLDFVLDKRDGRYDNPSYLAVDLLRLPGADPGGRDQRQAAHRRDRLVTLLVADTLRFELDAAEGRTALMPQMRPDARITAKRCRLGLRALQPSLTRLGLCAEESTDDPLAAARAVCRAVEADMSGADARTLQLTILPVSQVHDEYMFIRMLQSYETTFAAIGVHLTAAVDALADDRPAEAVRALGDAERTMREAAPLWSLVATVQPQAFLAFREFTEGASAIQSRSYKTVESLCRRPDESRLDSPAFDSVPEVRECVLAGHPTFDETLRGARASGRLTADVDGRLHGAMHRFETALLKWRQSHYRLALRMLGRRRGTGYTEGVPYLEKTRAIPVFNPA